MSAVFQTSFTGANLVAAPKSVTNGRPIYSTKVVAMAGTKKVKHLHANDSGYNLQARNLLKCGFF
jgi:hypothetical protein